MGARTAIPCDRLRYSMTQATMRLKAVTCSRAAAPHHCAETYRRHSQMRSSALTCLGETPLTWLTRYVPRPKRSRPNSCPPDNRFIDRRTASPPTSVVSVAGSSAHQVRSSPAELQANQSAHSTALALRRAALSRHPLCQSETLAMGLGRHVRSDRNQRFAHGVLMRTLRNAIRPRYACSPMYPEEA